MRPAGCAVSPVRESTSVVLSDHDDRDEYGDPDFGDPDVDAEHSTGEALLLYLPNRLLDIFDIERVRARLGAGAALDVLVSRALNLFVVSYQSCYIGLPGPRNRPEIKAPFGSESWSELGVAEAEDSVDRGWDGPDFGLTEIGVVGIHALLIGVDVEVDPIEEFDFVLRLLTIDVMADDL